MNIILALLFVWSIPWKIYAVWMASKHDHKKWFVVLIMLNTLSILELIYVFHVLGKKWSEVKHDFKKGWEILKKEVRFKKK